MTTSVTVNIRERVQHIESMPAIPAVFLPLLNLLSGSGENVNVDEVVRLVSYDNTIAAQCLRVAASPLFGMALPPKSIKAAVISLGLRRVETILLTCCLGQAFPSKKWCWIQLCSGDIRWDAPWYAGNSARSWAPRIMKRLTWRDCCTTSDSW
jgi:HD-like signal output (HDOD) protein